MLIPGLALTLVVATVPAPAAAAPVAEGPAEPLTFAPAAAPAPAPMPRWRGTGTLVVGSLAAATGLGLGLATAGFLGQCFHRVDGCEHPPLLLPALSHTFHLIAIVNLSVGGALRGRFEGRRDLAGGAVRSRPGLIPGGAVVLGAGGLLMIGGFVWLSQGDHDRNPAGRWAMSQIGFTTMAAGAGLLAYGRAYGRHSAAGPRVRVTPQFAPGFAGLAVVGRF